MPLKFTCPHCGSDIVVKCLKIGESAFCRLCYEVLVVPQDASVVDDSEYSRIIGERNNL